MTLESVGATIASINALLNASSFLLLLVGYSFIRRGRIPQHQRCMTAAVVASGLFLALYVVRFSLTGTHSFQGPDAVRPLYLTILFSHMTLAIVIVPLVLRLLFLARRERFEAHRRLARWTFPIWLYVSATGLVVYLMLYRLYAG